MLLVSLIYSKYVIISVIVSAHCLEYPTYYVINTKKHAFLFILTSIQISRYNLHFLLSLQRFKCNRRQVNITKTTILTIKLFYVTIDSLFIRRNATICSWIRNSRTGGLYWAADSMCIRFSWQQESHIAPKNESLIA